MQESTARRRRASEATCGYWASAYAPSALATLARPPHPLPVLAAAGRAGIGGGSGPGSSSDSTAAIGADMVTPSAVAILYTRPASAGGLGALRQRDVRAVQA